MSHAEVIFDDNTDEQIHSDYLLRRHWWMLATAAAVVVLSFSLTVQEDERVAFRHFPEYPLPQTCASRSWFGIDCPGCGLTRSIIYLATGDWQASFANHQLGWLMALAIALQFPYRIYMIRHGPDAGFSNRTLNLFSTTLIVLLVLNWLLSFVWVSG